MTDEEFKRVRRDIRELFFAINFVAIIFALHACTAHAAETELPMSVTLVKVSADVTGPAVVKDDECNGCEAGLAQIEPGAGEQVITVEPSSNPEYMIETENYE